MIHFPRTIILRHRRENLKKCSLRTLPKREDLQILTYPTTPLPDLSSYLMLKVEAPPLTLDDCKYGLFFIDATWRLAAIMEKQCSLMQARSLPAHFRTAYPRRQTDCSDPTAGLATLEALFLSYRILKRPTDNILNGYIWEKQFIELNSLEN